MAVYLIRAGENGPVKIGYSADVRARRAELQTGCPERLHVLAVMLEGSEADEARLHKKFAAHRIHGDWFCAAPEVLAEFGGLQGLERGALTVDDIEHPLARYLARKGIREAFFARAIGVNPSTIHRVLRRKRTPTLDMAIKISDATNGAVTCLELADAA